MCALIEQPPEVVRGEFVVSMCMNYSVPSPPRIRPVISPYRQQAIHKGHERATDIYFP